MTDISRSFDDLTPERVTTAFDLPGHTTVRSLGVAQGSSCARARSSARSARRCKPLRRQHHVEYVVCEKARQQAFDKMLGDAQARRECDRRDAHDSTEIGRVSRKSSATARPCGRARRRRLTVNRYAPAAHTIAETASVSLQCSRSSEVMFRSCGNNRIHVSATAIVAAPPTTIAAGALPPCGRHARLEFAELVRRTDEQRIDRAHAPEHVVGRTQLHERQPHDDADDVRCAERGQRHERQREVPRQPNTIVAMPNAITPPNIARPGRPFSGNRVSQRPASAPTAGAARSAPATGRPAGCRARRSASAVAPPNSTANRSSDSARESPARG